MTAALFILWTLITLVVGIVIGTAIRRADEAEVQQADEPTRSVERVA